MLDYGVSLGRTEHLSTNNGSGEDISAISPC